MDSAQRRLLSMRIENDPELRQRFDDLVSGTGDFLGLPDADDWEVFGIAMSVAIDLEPAKPPRLREGNPHRPNDQREPQARYHVRTYPVAAEDQGMREQDLEIKYSLLHVIQWMRAGITIAELKRLGLPEAWSEIAGWVAANS